MLVNLLNILYFIKKSKSRNCLLRSVREERRTVEDAAPYERCPNKKRHCFRNGAFYRRDQIARSTLLERRHLVQAYTWQGVPLTTALTRFTLGFQVRLERLWEWETLIPKVTPLPQKSHLAIRCTSYLKNTHNSPVHRRLDMIADIDEKCKHFFQKNWIFSKIILILCLGVGIMVT